VGPIKAELLKKEAAIFTFYDLLHYYPFRYIDKTNIAPISALASSDDSILVLGKIVDVQLLGDKFKKRLVMELADASGRVQLVWFTGISWVEKNVLLGQQYMVFGKATTFNHRLQMSHPEIAPWVEEIGAKDYLEPVYPSTEKLKTRGLGGRQIGNLTKQLFNQLVATDVEDLIPTEIVAREQLFSRFRALQAIHFPSNNARAEQAIRTLKFEELFLAQLKMETLRNQRHRFSKGVIFEKVGDAFNTFYNEHLPFALTNAQKRVVKEIRKDTASGHQMNRLLQGDVGSGKTVVALLIMLLAIDNGFQACMMAPTEILARQHLASVTELVKELPIKVCLLTGSVKAADRKKIFPELISGEIHILIGTHAVIEDVVQFKNLGLIIIDEQHRFGVAQRAKLWAKAPVPPHVLVMTATPIPRTLAMATYGDLDISIIDELPAGRKPITTIHRYEKDRSALIHFIRAEIDKGRQAYIIFPLIEESETLDYENLMQGFEVVKTYFPEPRYLISMVHGKQKAAQKELNMKRFVEGQTQIMVSTTVIEVGINVPNATIMVVENAEKFGLSQLHQLRGRVGRGAEKSYCILLTGQKLTREGRARVEILTKTQNGFEIAEKDLELRGPGEIDGTRQSGDILFKLANIITDSALLELARMYAYKILNTDPDLQLPEHGALHAFLNDKGKKIGWVKIS